MITILEAKRAGQFGRGKLLPNIIAGVIVGVVALPLAMAFAIASGARPEQGLYTAIIGGFMVSALGGSRVQIAGPTGAFIAILSGVTARYGIDGLQIATLMAGLMLVLMGMAKLGGVIKFIPAPVIVGFTTGIGVIIWVGQWRDFLGLPKISGDHFHEKLWQLLLALPHLHIATTGVALFSLLLVMFSSRIRGLQRVPGPLVAMVAATFLQSIFHFKGVATIGSAFDGIPQGLPNFSFPSVTPERVIELMGPAFTIAMLGAIESLLSAVVADGMTGVRHDSNQELIGQGLANIVAPLFGGFAATGAIARTATNIRNGGTSPLAGITHTLTLALIVLFFAPMAANIPLASLAAILFVVAYNMSELKHFTHIVKRAPRADVVILLITFLLTVFTDLVVAVNIGVILAILQFLRRMAAAVEVQQMGEEKLKRELLDQGLTNLPAGVLVYEIDGPFFFGAVENFERALLQTHTDPRILILRLRRVPFMDITGLQTLDEVIGKLKKRHVRVMICEANHRVRAKLWKVGILEFIKPEDYADEFSTLLKHASTIALFGDSLSCHVHLSEHAANVLKVSSRYLRSDRE
ncbi:sulfate permease, SulP family [Pseudogulbenkiania subflava DSM 22618]|uniref:Sulfate permease, SulP family n=2 Tax=Pseudogulbenkiania subflava TaxID=451637 RepID=A0A1Y6BXR4_9NEIS|nr:sulfate permease, SulP family [Pseudogulbenkiania subflava DSM 22618]SMF32932.1 sulfate permease, SulP family [Pseudogulbenkiania subflava DSM 22618]SMF47893.1 sulfate permease, SulP family [Pseudogulbenkiania subflava DSM 22618]